MTTQVINIWTRKGSNLRNINENSMVNIGYFILNASTFECTGFSHPKCTVSDIEERNQIDGHPDKFKVEVSQTMT